MKLCGCADVQHKVDGVDDSRTKEKHCRERITMNITHLEEDTYTVIITDIERIIRIITIIVVMLLILTTNGTIATVLYHTDKLTANTTYFIGSLCASDLLTGVLFITTLVSALYEKWVFGKVMCIVASLISAIVISITSLTLTMMIVDKFLFLRYPLRYHTVQKKYVALVVITSWIVVITVLLLLSNVFNYQAQYNNDMYMCLVEFTIEINRPVGVITAWVLSFPIGFTYMYIVMLEYTKYVISIKIGSVLNHRTG